MGEARLTWLGSILKDLCLLLLCAALWGRWWFWIALPLTCYLILRDLRTRS